MNLGTRRKMWYGEELIRNKRNIHIEMTTVRWMEKLTSSEYLEKPFLWNDALLPTENKM